MGALHFEDNFSTQSALYAKMRPQYPDALFSFLAHITKDHQLAWDVGCGNGQSALSLTRYFDAVCASDPSAQQIAHAKEHPQIQYKVQRAEDCDLPIRSVDLITAANALHWFNLHAFYNIVRKVLKPNGVIAAWCYGIPEIDTKVDAIVRKLHDDILGPFWVHANRLVDGKYKDLDFPFHLVDTPAYISTKAFDLSEFLDYLRTWSAVQKYMLAIGEDPVVVVADALAAAWGNAQEKKVLTWEIITKVGKV